MDINTLKEHDLLLLKTPLFVGSTNSIEGKVIKNTDIEIIIGIFYKGIHVDTLVGFKESLTSISWSWDSGT